MPLFYIFFLFFRHFIWRFEILFVILPMQFQRWDCRYGKLAPIGRMESPHAGLSFGRAAFGRFFCLYIIYLYLVMSVEFFMLQYNRRLKPQISNALMQK